MLRTIFFFSLALILHCGYCHGDEIKETLVVTLEPGESIMIKTSDGESNVFINYGGRRPNKEFDYKTKKIGIDRSYHIDYHLIIWTECPACRTYYNAVEGGCKNQYCPSRML